MLCNCQARRVVKRPVQCAHGREREVRERESGSRKEVGLGDGLEGRRDRSERGAAPPAAAPGTQAALPRALCTAAARVPRQQRASLPGGGSSGPFAHAPLLAARRRGHEMQVSALARGPWLGHKELQCGGLRDLAALMRISGFLVLGVTRRCRRNRLLRPSLKKPALLTSSSIHTFDNTH